MTMWIEFVPMSMAAIRSAWPRARRACSDSAEGLRREDAAIRGNEPGAVAAPRLAARDPVSRSFASPFFRICSITLPGCAHTRPRLDQPARRNERLDVTTAMSFLHVFGGCDARIHPHRSQVSRRVDGGRQSRN